MLPTSEFVRFSDSGSCTFASPKSRQFHVPLVIQQDVLRLEIPVRGDVQRVEMTDGAHNFAA